MDYIFAPENPSPNYTLSVLFSSAILLAVFVFIIALKTQGVNLKNFPKESMAKLYSLLFIVSIDYLGSISCCNVCILSILVWN